MKAMEYKEYGSPEVLRLQEVAKPVPEPDQVLIRVFATTVTAADIMMRKGKPYIGRFYLGLRKPKRSIPGFEFAGEVAAVGNAVTRFKTGDRVFGGTTTLGCYAEYVCVNENDVITTMPENISFEEAAPVNGSAITVMNFLKGQTSIRKDQKVLINGASGALGTYAIQIAKYFGAEVTGVCSTPNLKLVRSLGADRVIDYTKEDFTARRPGNDREKYDVIFDIGGRKSFVRCKKILAPNGVYLSAVLSFSLLIQMARTAVFGRKKAKFSSTGMLPVRKRLHFFLELKELLRKGVIKTVIDRTYPLAEISEAHRYVENGHKKGNVIMAV